MEIDSNNSNIPHYNASHNPSPSKLSVGNVKTLIERWETTTKDATQTEYPPITPTRVIVVINRSTSPINQEINKAHNIGLKSITEQVRSEPLYGLASSERPDNNPHYDLAFSKSQKTNQQDKGTYTAPLRRADLPVDVEPKASPDALSQQPSTDIYDNISYSDHDSVDEDGYVIVDPQEQQSDHVYTELPLRADVEPKAPSDALSQQPSTGIYDNTQYSQATYDNISYSADHDSVDEDGYVIVDPQEPKNANQQDEGTHTALPRRADVGSLKPEGSENPYAQLGPTHSTAPEPSTNVYDTLKRPYYAHLDPTRNTPRQPPITPNENVVPGTKSPDDPHYDKLKSRPPPNPNSLDPNPFYESTTLHSQPDPRTRKEDLEPTESPPSTEGEPPKKKPKSS